MGAVDQIGVDLKDNYVDRPILCNYGIKIKQIACGDSHTLLLTKQG
jgi:alpha-tubulin suppressor-like RCC1 family protein